MWVFWTLTGFETGQAAMFRTLMSDSSDGEAGRASAGEPETQLAQRSRQLRTRANSVTRPVLDDNDADSSESDCDVDGCASSSHDSSNFRLVCSLCLKEGSTQKILRCLLTLRGARELLQRCKQYQLAWYRRGQEVRFE